MTDMAYENWLTPTEAANKAHMGAWNISRLCKEGKLRHIKTRFGRLIDPASLDEYLAYHPRRKRTTDLTNDEKQWYKVSEAAEKIGVTKSYVYHWAKQGRVESIHTVQGVLINPKSVERLIAERKEAYKTD
jgi:excisionase family DNA binding protein